MPKIPFWVFIVIAILYFTAARVDVMDVDASQYAEISREMMLSGEYLQIFDRGRDYLDKPPFLFWVSSLSMKIFGSNNFGFKLPSILFALWALFATYKLSKLLYDERTARMAALILACCQGMFLMTNDIRTDTVLMSWTITAIWLIKEWDIHRKLIYLLAGSAAIAFGMMTKGPIALMVPVFCFATDWALKRQWKSFFHPAYLLSLITIAIFLIPMSIGLYQQYDLQPDKYMDGKNHVSGLRFFYWTQSFGRITGENTWDNNAPFSFLLENMLWAFLPWILLFLIALVLNTTTLIKQKLKLHPHQEWLTTGGFILAYIALGSSHYQLPHYIFIAFPLAAIMVASLLKDFFEGKYQKLYRVMKPVQTGISFLLLVAALLTFVIVFPGTYLTYMLWAIGTITWLYVAFNKKIQGKILWISATAIIAANVIMTNHFYFNLLHHQAGSQIGRFIKQHNLPTENIRYFNINDPLNSMHFYAQKIIKREDTLSHIQPGTYVVTGQEGLDQINKHNLPYQIMSQGSFFKVSELTPDFLSPSKRPRAMKPYYIIKTGNRY